MLLRLPQSARKLCRKFSQVINQELTVKHLKDKPGIVEISLNRPAAKNAFNRTLLRSLQNAIDDIKSDKLVRVVVVRSSVPGVFSAGADLKERTRMTESEVVEFVTALRNSFEDVARLPPPVIAAVDGVALGGGLELALACDIRVASTSAKLGLVETKLGIIPGAGGTQRLARLINPSLAKELIFTGRVMDGREAADIGLVGHVVEGNQSGDAAFVKAVQLAEQIAPNGPIAVRYAKRAIDVGLDSDIETGLKAEQALYLKIVPTKDRIEGLLAFRDKRVPTYTGE